MKPLTLAAALFAAAAFAAHAMPGTTTEGATLKGQVLEVQDAGSYTYLRLKTKDGETWAAVSAASLKKGDQVTLAEPMVMTHFESKSLKRKFDRIVLGTLVDPKSKAANAPASPHGATPATAPLAAKVARAKGADARTVAELFDGRAALKDKSVTIRGQVVKVSAGILGKNWLHLQDGSGSADKGTHDLIVTTKDTAKVGDVVNASGTVRTDVNVGSGYAYAVLVEDAKIRK